MQGPMVSPTDIKMQRERRVSLLEGWVLDVKEKDVRTRKSRVKAQGLEAVENLLITWSLWRLKQFLLTIIFFPSILLGSQSSYLVLELGQPRHRDSRRVPSKEK